MGETAVGPKPITVKYGLNHVVALIVIAHDVEPIEVVVFLPTLCRKMDIPYVVVKGKSRLGSVVHKKTATCLAFTNVAKADEAAFNKLCESVNVNFNSRYNEIRRKWGGGIMGAKTVHKVAMYEKAKAKEAAARMG